MSTQRHEPTDECSGEPRPTIVLGPGTRPFSARRCPECGTPMCPCEEAYGHECEEAS